ncbi:hypothetical protein [Flavobacterium sp.]|uniref:hypothetical protein n=1 Tax=Flavobacterium sp. TaxID=239 RepID=UPI003D0F42F3
MSSQSITALEEVVVRNKVDFSKILKKIKSKLNEKSDTVGVYYNLKMNLLQDEKTLIDIDDTLQLKMKSMGCLSKLGFSKKYANKMESLIAEKFNTFKYRDSPLHWIAEFPLRKNLNVSKLDFLNNLKEYRYELVDENSMENGLVFVSDSLYSGKMVYNKQSKELVSIIYENVTPYRFYNIVAVNARKYDVEQSNWKYLKEKVILKFSNKNPNVIETLSIEETIDNFNSKQFNKKGEVEFSLLNDYKSIFKLTRLTDSIKG